MFVLLLNAGAGSAFVSPACSMVRHSGVHRGAPAAMMDPERMILTVDANGARATKGLEITGARKDLACDDDQLKCDYLCIGAGTTPSPLNPNPNPKTLTQPQPQP